jgi:hypothetical protein
MLMTMTTSRRLALFKRTLDSLRENVIDLYSFVDRCLVIDDHSDRCDVDEMHGYFDRYLPSIKLTIIGNSVDNQWRHVNSMNMWLDAIRDEQLVFHLEDDWGFMPPRRFVLDWAVNVLQTHNWVAQACFRAVTDRITKPHPDETFWVDCLENYPPDPNRKSPWHWPSRFTLNPAVTRVAVITGLGQFKPVSGFERVFGLKMVEAGYTTVYHPQGFCQHIGAELSAYEINGSTR